MSTVNGNTAGTRYHALDSLRAAMMFLGVYIHAIAPFSTIPDVWWYRDTAAGAAFDIQLLAIHAFRMPVFFAMAGFFGALLLERRGATAFAANRATRVLLPLAASLALLIPLLKALQLSQRLIAGTGTIRAADFLEWYPRMLGGFQTGPYWFLLYLVYFYLLALALQPLARRILAGSRGSRLRRGFDALVGTGRGPYVLAAASAGGLLAVPAGVFPAPQGFLPEGRILAVYGPFVLFGWVLYHHRQQLDRFSATAWRHCVLGAAWMAVLIAACRVQLSDSPWSFEAFLITVAAGSCCVWEMLFALLGLFQRYLDGQRHAWRYASDSSYWIYLVHSPALLAAQVLVCRTSWPGSLKLLAGLLVAVPILFASYHWLVRPTWVGAWLNGRRFPIRGTIPPPDRAASVLASPIGTSTR